MVVRVQKLFPDAKLPARADSGVVGFDVCAYRVLPGGLPVRNAGELPTEVPPSGSILFGSGLCFDVPFPYDCEIRPRSGLALRHQITILNSPGTIDPSFRGELGVILINHGQRPFRVEKGDRIAQIIFKEVEVPRFLLVDELQDTARGTGGFGSTGLNDDISAGDAEWQSRQIQMDERFLRMAVTESENANCLRGVVRGTDGSWPKDARGRYIGSTRKIGCVIVKDGTIIGQGFNMRTPSECSEAAGCIRERECIPSGTRLEVGCVHAEQMAIQNCMRVGASLKGAVVYITSEPCLMCSKNFYISGIVAIVVPKGVYPTNGLKFMQDNGIEVRHVDI